MDFVLISVEDALAFRAVDFRSILWLDSSSRYEMVLAVPEGGKTETWYLSKERGLAVISAMRAWAASSRV